MSDEKTQKKKGTQKRKELCAQKQPPELGTKKTPEVWRLRSFSMVAHTKASIFTMVHHEAYMAAALSIGNDYVDIFFRV